MSEVASWYRIQEMFRFQSFHMYGIIGTAVAVAALSVCAHQAPGPEDAGTGSRSAVAPRNGATAACPAPATGSAGTLFGLGWALIGACPGPMFALAGRRVSVMVLGLVSAMAGTWAYAAPPPH
jgi:uncharacterized protein